MTPFASVAMHEKLALLKIARCRAPALSSTSSACLREVASPALLETSIFVLASPSALIIGVASGNRCSLPWVIAAADRSKTGPYLFGRWVLLSPSNPTRWTHCHRCAIAQTQVGVALYGRRSAVASGPSSPGPT